MSCKQKSIIDYFCSIIEENRTLHFFKLYGEEQDVDQLAKEKALELNGEYIITKNNSRSSINVVVSCFTHDWINQITNPVITSSIKGLAHAQ